MTQRRILYAGVVLSLFVFCAFQLYHYSGFVHATKKPGSLFHGCICHGEKPTPTVQVIISGPESLALGETGMYTLFVLRDTNIAGGFNVAAFFGDLGVGDTMEQQWIEGELTHTFPKLSNGSDTIGWVFRYQAPEVPTFDTLYAVGNSVDTSYDPLGDFWNFSENFIVRVGNPMTSADDSRALPVRFGISHNYPNPFNPSTVIRYRLPEESHVSLRVYDLTGREVARLVERAESAGNHEVVFDATGLSGGVYFYRIWADKFAVAGKMVVAK